MKINYSFPLFLLGLLFLTLKLCHVIDWAWVWVLAPFWSVPALVLLCLAVSGIALLVYVLSTTKEEREEEKRRRKLRSLCNQLATGLRR